MKPRKKLIVTQSNQDWGNQYKRTVTDPREGSVTTIADINCLCNDTVDDSVA